MIDRVVKHPVCRPEPKQSSSSLHENALQNMPMNVMAKFVRQHRLDFFGFIVVEQCIGQNNPARIPESG